VNYVTTTLPCFQPYAKGMIKQTQTSPGTLRNAWIHALKAGTWAGLSGSVSISPVDLAQIAQSYNPSLHEAPVVLGHPATDDPAFGWVRSAELRSDGLWLETGLVPELADMFDRELYKKVSVSLYPPDSPANPMPGSYYLKHLGFLGAQPPAVKGLKGVIYNSEDTDHITIEFMEARMGDENKDPAVALAEKQTAILLQEQKVTDREKTVDLAEKDLARREREFRRKEWKQTLQTHIQAGRLLPAQESFALALMESLEGKTVDLGEGDKPLLDGFQNFLSALPVQVPLGEKAAGEKLPAAPAVSFAAPSEYEVNSERLALHAQVKAWMAKNPGKTYVEAIQAIEGGAS